MVYIKKAKTGVFQSNELVGNHLKMLKKDIISNKERVYTLLSCDFMFTFEYRTKKDISFKSMKSVCISEKVRFCTYGIKLGTKFQLYGDEIVVKN
ncbi:MULTISPECIES: hypothetical protein [Staphylococcus]|uniref:hypothetical protein n=1 Tax=Staphylococcus TaxID=1279 RepID=UPI00194E4EA3|nr:MULTISPECIES: hypothetical protein [Staphylococcus]MCT2552782.1 hypothetical protein [Staphylococcus aureus]MCT2556132.1 hypothetical protein [Staphylococcus aureus]MCT2567486.1 hypothetical protein [Staphylococcus aureus]MCT2571711.1 hypothetical protein [Staphylococcus aureus]MCT2574326.1 hypothetical protein [Staphylococcus aureus]